MILLPLVLFLAAAPSSFAGLQMPTKAARRMVVPAGTPVRLTIVAPINSRSFIQGQRFALRLAEDLAVGSRVVIPRGTAAVGEVEAVSGKGMFGKPGRLVLRPLFIDFADERVNLIGASTDKGHDGTAAAAVTTVLIGAFGLVITGKSATVPAGSTLLGRVRSDVSLPIDGERRGDIPTG
jgi:hypothetical protein